MCNYILHDGLHIVYFFSVALVIIIYRTDNQDKGYFWLSYECADTQFFQFIMQDNSAYDNEYQLGYYCGAAVNVDKSANIFTAKSDEEIT